MYTLELARAHGRELQRDAERSRGRCCRDTTCLTTALRSTGVRRLRGPYRAG